MKRKIDVLQVNMGKYCNQACLHCHVEAGPGRKEMMRRETVDAICSLPCYTEENVDSQRGDGTFEASVRGLRALNDLGYGKPATGLKLHLVYNPLGGYLPPPQD